VRLVSAGPLFFLLLGAFANAGCSTPQAGTTLHPAVELRRDTGALRVQAEVACTRGDLEQVCCTRGTRDHESLLVTAAPASAVQAGLLALGAQAGRPGFWRQAAAGELEEQPPLGSPLEVRVRWQESGLWREVPIAAWLDDRRPGPDETRFVFAGSRFVNTPQGSASRRTCPAASWGWSPSVTRSWPARRWFRIGSMSRRRDGAREVPSCRRRAPRSR